MQELCKDHSCRGSFYILHALIDKRPFTQVLNDQLHFYHGHRTGLNWLDNLQEDRFPLHGMSELHFVGAATSAGTEEFCQCMFACIEHCSLAFSIRVRVTQQESFSKHLPDVLNNLVLHHFMCRDYKGLHDFGKFGPFYRTEIGQIVADLVTIVSWGLPLYLFQPCFPITVFREFGTSGSAFLSLLHSCGRWQPLWNAEPVPTTIMVDLCGNAVSNHRVLVIELCITSSGHWTRGWDEPGIMHWTPVFVMQVHNWYTVEFCWVLVCCSMCFSF